MAKVMYQGLNRRETYNEILGYLERGGGPGIDIAFPNRTASFIRASPQYQNLLTYDFIDLQKQQENMLKQQKRDIIVKEQASGSNASMKSVLSSESPAVSEASQQVQSDLSGVSSQSIIGGDLMAEIEYLDELQRERDKDKTIRGQQLIQEHLADVTRQHEYLGGQRAALAAAKATGTEDYSGATGSKFLEQHIAEGQRLGLLRVLPKGVKNPPPYITELSKDKEAVERQRQRLGLSPDPQTQAASSSSSGPVQFDIRTPRPDRSKSTKGTKGETNEPETNVAKRRGRPVNPDSARQKALAKKDATK